MRPLRARIADETAKAKAPQLVVEKDYALSYILAGISRQDMLKDRLVFKGGTALRKVFFGDYRFSEDLDYSAIEAPKGKTLRASMESAGQEAKRLFLEQGPFEVIVRRYEERDPHPHGQEAFIFHVQFPWHPSPLCRIKVEISHDEPVILSPDVRPLIHGYQERLTADIRCYALTEIVAEKLRTLLQTHRKLMDRGWTRPRARDYYDLWRLFAAYGRTFDRAELRSVLRQKCRRRDVAYHGIPDFFTPELLAEAKTHWESTLGMFVGDLPPFQKVIADLEKTLPKYLQGD
jgi:uncharacterized protein